MYSEYELFEMANGLTLKMPPAFMELEGTLCAFDNTNNGIKFLDAEYQARHENPETRPDLYKELNAYFFMRKPKNEPDNKSGRTIRFPI